MLKISYYHYFLDNSLLKYVFAVLMIYVDRRDAKKHVKTNNNR